MTRLAVLLLALTASAPAFACDGGPLYEQMQVTPAGAPGATFDVAEVGSTEGGDWQVWLGPDGKTARELIRNDYGEGGRHATRLSISSPTAFGIRDTDVIYTAPSYISGSSTMREETDVYVFCDGKLLLPEGEYGPDPSYLEASKEALAVFDAPEVKQYLAGLKR